MAFSHGTPNSIVTDGLVFCVDAANKVSWTGPNSSTVNNLVSTNTGSIVNDTSGSYGDNNSFPVTIDGVVDVLNQIEKVYWEIAGIVKVDFIKILILFLWVMVVLYGIIKPTIIFQQPTIIIGIT